MHCHNQERFFDLEVSVERKTLRAQKAVLCAASKYLQFMFNGIRQIELGEIAENAAMRIFDYIYTGAMTPITPSEDPQKNWKTWISWRFSSPISSPMLGMLCSTLDAPRDSYPDLGICY